MTHNHERGVNTMLEPDEWEIMYAVRLLESVGHIVLRPTEASFPVVVEVESMDRPHYGQIGVRVAVEQRGERYCLRESFPAELVCQPDETRFRENDLPRILAQRLGRYLADQMQPAIAEQVAQKIKPFIFPKRFSLAEIEGFIAMALDTRYSREDVDAAFPQFRPAGE